MQYRDIEYQLKKSKRKTTSIYIERDGSVSVLAPEPYDMNEIEAILEAKRSWIYRNLAEWEDLNRTRVEREFVSGEGFLYLGSSYRLRIVEEQPEPLILKNGYFCLQSNALPKAQEAFVVFYRTKAKQRIPERVVTFSSKMGVEAKGVRIQDLNNRWASCSADGTLNFHWRCMMAPLTVLDYIVAHELSHIHHPNHSPEFWDQIERVLPDFQDAKTWLKINGAGLTL